MTFSQFQYLAACSDQAHDQNDPHFYNMVVRKNLDRLYDLNHQQYIKKKYGDCLCVFRSIIKASLAESLLKTFYSVPDQLNNLVGNDHQSESEEDHGYDSF